MTLKFTPPGNTARFALSIGSFFKIYNDVARAKIAWHSHRWSSEPAHILELVDGQWFVLYTVQPNTRAENLPWYAETYGYVRGVGWRTRNVAKPMSREDYASWRLQVNHELLAEKSLPEIAALFGVV